MWLADLISLLATFEWSRQKELACCLFTYGLASLYKIENFIEQKEEKEYKPDDGGIPRIELGTSRTLSENHTTRLNALFVILLMVCDKRFHE